MTPTLSRRDKKGIIAWCFFDWANSAFPAIVTTFVFATYFVEAVAPDRLTGTKLWGDMIALSGIVIALLSPVFGAIADYHGRRLPWIAIFSVLMTVGMALLWFAEPNPGAVFWTLACVFWGTIGFEIGSVFYNAMLSDLAPRNYLGRISGWAWGFGYFGGLMCLILCLVLFIQNEVSWLDTSLKEHIRICGPLCAVWFLAFAWPMFLMTPDRPASGISLHRSIGLGVKTLYETLKTLPQHGQIFRFLCANMIYMDGLNTIFAFGGIYAAGSFGFTFQEIMYLGIAMNVTAGLGAAGFAWVDDGIGAKITILIALVLMIITGTGLLIVTTKLGFWIFALLLSIAVGPIQAASRSLLIRLSPPDMTTEMFGLFALSGKVTAFLGPWLLGYLTITYGTQRIGMAGIIGFLCVGFLLMIRVKEPHRRPHTW